MCERGSTVRNMRGLVVVLALLFSVIGSGLATLAVTSNGVLVLGTWNVRGYPEKTSERRSWFSAEIAKIAPDILCVQEIANQADVSRFINRERGFTSAAFNDSADKMDNALFFTKGVQVVDLPDPQGFQHPAQAVYFRYRGLDAVLITVHLSWSDSTKRDKERSLLARDVQAALQIDPDVIVTGDFNTTERTGDKISSLAKSCGLRVLAADNPDVGTTYAGKSYDFILVSPDLAQEEAFGSSHVVKFAPVDIEVAKAVSDHRPVIASFRTDEKYADCVTWPPESLLSFSWDTTTTAVSTASEGVSCLEALNSAGYNDFRAVDGIGDVLARRLVMGQPYAAVDALDDIPGIGPVRMKAIIDFLSNN